MNDPPQHISPVSAEDHLRLVDVWEASVRETHQFLAEADIQFYKALVGEALSEDLQLACVRDSAGVPAGFIGVAGEKIEMLFVHPDWRGQGLGRLLLRYAIQTLGAATVDVNEQNEQAIGFYVRMGFQVEGRSELDSTGRPFPLLHLRMAGMPE